MATVTTTITHDAMTLADQCIDMLGKTAKDKVTGYEGVVSSIYFDLYGCIQIALTAKYDKEHTRSRLDETRMYDVQRLEITSEERVMEIPKHYLQVKKPEEHTHGPAERGAPPIILTREHQTVNVEEFATNEEFSVNEDADEWRRALDDKSQ